jgi:dTDP-4-amino-4,6-dideoxygalactose transaminase
MGGTLSTAEVRLALRLFVRPLSSEPGRAVAAFESAFADAVRVPHAAAFSSGRVALWAILQAIGLGEGDEVIVPGYTCVAVPNAVRFAGGRPVYADVDPRTFNVTAESCRRVLTPRARALVVGHTYGLPAPMEALKALAVRHRLFLIEDVAHALGSTYHGRPAGSWGDAAFFSTEHSKIITTGLGGVATCADPEVAARLREIQASCPPPGAGRVRRLLIPHLAIGLWYRKRQIRLGDLMLYRSRLYHLAIWGTPPAEHDGIEPPGYRCRMGDAQARLGLEQLRRMPKLNAARVAAARAYEEALRERGIDLGLAGTATGDQTVYVRLPYRARRREALLAAGPAERLDLGLWFESPVHPGDTDLAAVGYAVGSCPEAERASREIVNLPCHPLVTFTDVSRYADLLARVEGR